MVPTISCAAVAAVWTVGGSVGLDELYFNQERCGVFKLASFLWFHFFLKKVVASRETACFFSYVKILNVKITKMWSAVAFNFSTLH